MRARKNRQVRAKAKTMRKTILTRTKTRTTPMMRKCQCKAPKRSKFSERILRLSTNRQSKTEHLHAKCLDNI